MLLKDKVALITGAASGIGQGVAEPFAREGARVALVDMNEGGLAETAGEGEGGRRRRLSATPATSASRRMSKGSSARRLRALGGWMSA